MLRPAAAALPRSSAVPEGASTFLLWCISTISMSNSGPSARAACLDEAGEEVHAEREIARLDDPRAGLRGRGDRRVVFGGAAGRSDDVDQTALGRELGEGNAGRRRGEVDDDVGARERRLGVVADGDAEGLDAREDARVLADRGRALAVERRDDLDLGRIREGADIGRAHAPAGSGDGNLEVSHRPAIAQPGGSRHLPDLVHLGEDRLRRGHRIARPP